MIDVPAPTETTVSLAAGALPPHVRRGVRVARAVPIHGPGLPRLRRADLLAGRAPDDEAALDARPLGPSPGVRPLRVHGADGGRVRARRQLSPQHGRPRDPRGTRAILPVGARSGGCARIPKLGRATAGSVRRGVHTAAGNGGPAAVPVRRRRQGETGPTIVDYRNVRIRMLAPFAVSITEGADARPARRRSRARAWVRRRSGPRSGARKGRSCCRSRSPPRRDGRSPAYPPGGR